MGTVEEFQMMYTEIVYFDDEGNEIGRVRMHDDYAYDSSSRPMTQDEREEWGLDD